ncbi:MAG: hypothetical protein K2O14_13400, partial [Oscillospiraceae bacterium]|nr:hypothetical protein [Oscillospiraceae bacterium]
SITITEDVSDLMPEPVRAKTVSLRKTKVTDAPDAEKLIKAIADSREIIDEVKKFIVPPSAERLPFYSINLPYVSDSFDEYKSKSEAKHRAADLLRPAYEGREREVRKAAARAVKDIRRVSIYEESDDNFCYRTEQKALEALRHCAELLEKAGAELPSDSVTELYRPIEEFDEDDVFELLHDDIVKTNGPFSLESYLSSNGEMIKDDCNGIFNITYRYFGVCAAADDMRKDIENAFKFALGLAWKRAVGSAEYYCKRIMEELDERLELMIQDAQGECQ